MSTNTPPNENGTDLGLPSDATKIGVDGTGATHYYSSYRHTAFVGEPNGKTHTFDLDATPCDTLDEWVGHVESQRGEWRALNYHDCDAFQHLADQLRGIADGE